MSRAHRAERTLRLLADPSRQHYVCRTCRAQQLRTLHSTPNRLAKPEKPFLERIRESVFGLGSSRDKEVEELEQKGRERTKELARKQEGSSLEQRRRADGKGIYEVAPVVDPEVNLQYVRATNWDDLERVGGVAWVKKQQDGEEKYQGFTPNKRLELTKEHWAKLLHNLAVEVLVLQKARRDVNQIWYPRQENGDTFQQSSSFQIKLTANGSTAASSRDSDAEGEILQAVQERIEATNEGLDEQAGWWQGLRSSPAPIEDAWMQIRVTDLTTRLAMAKRITQLTGQRVPDPVISNAKTIGDLYHAMRARDKPKKLARTEQLQKVQLELPNVAVYSRRQTNVHKEKRVGRWKVIEAEFEARGMPATGQNKLRRLEEVRQE